MEQAPVLAIRGHVTRGDIPSLCKRVRLLLVNSAADLILCDVSAVEEPDAVTVDALARLQLAARHYGRRVELRGVSAELKELLALTGLCDVMPSYEG